MPAIRYLNAGHMDQLGLDMAAITDLLEEAFRLKTRGDTLMPPKVFFHFEGDRFYSAMTSACPPLGYAGCKWQSGNPHNLARGLPYIQGLYVLNDHESGAMLAVMDAKWITGKRTAAASALVARYQARPGAKRLAILGCGLQGRAHLEALANEVTTLSECAVFDVVADVLEQFVTDMDGKHNHVRVQACESPQAALRDADIIVTGGPITIERRAIIEPGWIAPGALLVTIDYDSYVNDACIAAMDIVMTDDKAGLEDARLHEGKFTGVSWVDCELSELVAHGQGRRQNDRQRILAFNLGIALEDVATAAEIFRRAREQEIGIELPV